MDPLPLPQTSPSKQTSDSLPAVRWWIPLSDPIGISDGTVVDFYVHKSPAIWAADLEKRGNLSSIKYEISFEIHQVDVPWEQSTLERTAFQLAMTDALPTAPIFDPEESPEIESKLTRKVSIICATTKIYDLSTIDEQATSDAFDETLDCLRRMQSAYTLIAQWPMVLTSRETLPMMIPSENLSIGESSKSESKKGIFLLHNNDSSKISPHPDLTEVEMETLSTAIQRSHGAFMSYHRLRHDALVSLNRRGDYRSSLLSSASAAEVFLDDLLLHLLWEEEVSPESAGELFADPRNGIVKRLKSQYVGRLHGTWNPDQSGPTQAWKNDIARLRNRIIHAGHEPEIEEAKRAYEVLIALEQHGAERLAQRSKKFPRTALALCGRDGLQRRGKYTKQVEQLQNDPSEPHWDETFARWRREALRPRITNDGFIEEPNADRSALILVDSDGELEWVLHDEEAGMAARTNPNLDSLPNEQAEALRSLIENRSEGSLVFHGLKGFEPTEPWVGAHRRVPGQGAMVNNEDFY